MRLRRPPVFALSFLLALLAACGEGDSKPGATPPPTSATPSAAPGPKDPPIPADTEVQTTPSGLKYSVLQAGTGDVSPKLGDKVSVHYTGWLPEGKVFDSSRRRGEPAEFQVGHVIEGWNEALQKMTKGARWKLTIPGALGYGAGGNPSGGIPPNATLIFDVELLEVHSVPVFRAANPAAQKKTESGLVHEVIREGEGEPPGPKDGFEMKYALWTISGRLLEASEQNGQTISASVENAPLPFFREAVQLMRPGSRHRFEVPPALAFASQSMPGLPPDSVTVWELELLSVHKPMPVPPFALSAPGKATKQPSGLEIETLAEGTGASPRLGDFVLVHYAGWLTDGKLFDSSYERGVPIKFRLGQVIQGWNEGLQKMKVGGKARLTIPGPIAYGPQGRPPHIGADATLVFVVELLAVNP